MKITGFETFQVDGGWESFSFLKVTTDEGLVGWSEFNEARGRKGLTGLILSVAKSLVGKDPRAINRHRRAALCAGAFDDRRPAVPRQRGAGQRLPRHQGKGAERAGL